MQMGGYWAPGTTDSNANYFLTEGYEYVELHGAEISGTAEVVGEIPRMSSPNDELARPELLFARKYFGADTFFPDGRHAWLRVTPEKLTSWDFRKLYPPSATD